MKSILGFLTGSYDGDSLYIKRKAEYISVFMLLILVVMVSILSAEIIVFGFSSLMIGATIGYIAGFGFIFTLLRKGFLEISLDLLILSGFVRCLQVMNDFPGIQFYSFLFLVLLTVGVVHIKHYQLYMSYAVSLLLFLTRMILYRIGGSVNLQSFYQALYSFFFLIIYIIMIQFIVSVIEKEISESSKLAFLAETDTLTGAGNRRKLHKTLAGFGQGFKTKGYSLLLLDLDHFKKVNDEHGHDRGDLVLQDLVNVIQREIRNEDSLYRWGGEEFLVLIPSTGEEDTMKAAERIREAVESHEFAGGLRITVSIGAVTGEVDDELPALIRRADDALYRAKESGRNRVCAYAYVDPP